MLVKFEACVGMTLLGGRELFSIKVMNRTASVNRADRNVRLMRDEGSSTVTPGSFKPRLLAAVLIGVLFFSGPAFSQEEKQEGLDTKSAVQIIVLSGLAGAVLGLSTLSFYDNPQRNLRNISIGAAIAVVMGTLYVTTRTAMGSAPSSLDLDGGKPGTMLEPPPTDFSLARDDSSLLHPNDWQVSVNVVTISF